MAKKVKTNVVCPTCGGDGGFDLDTMPVQFAIELISLTDNRPWKGTTRNTEGDVIDIVEARTPEAVFKRLNDRKE